MRKKKYHPFVEKEEAINYRNYAKDNEIQIFKS